MRLIKCYIENFGMLSAYSCEFSRGLNCIFAKNSTGKTTLSAFIKAMLFGLSDTRKSDLNENDRKKYYPWQGGSFGGSLSVEVKGKRYIIERSFGKRPAEDRFTLRNFDTGSVVYDYSERFGEEVLGICRDGFSKTAHLSEQDTADTRGYASISARLSGAKDGSDDYERAMRVLDDRRRFYRKRGGGGEIAEERARLDRLNDEENELGKIKASLPELERGIFLCRAEVEGLETRRGELTRALSEVGKSALTRADNERIITLKERIRSEKDRLSENTEFFSGVIPTHSEVDRAKDSYNEAQRLKNASEGPLGDVLDRLTERYKDKLSSEELYEIDGCISRLEGIRSQITATEGEGDTSEIAVPRGTEYNPKKDRMRSWRRKLTGISYACAGVCLMGVGALLGVFKDPLWYVLSVLGTFAAALGIIKLVYSKKSARGMAKTEFSPPDSYQSYPTAERERILYRLRVEARAVEERVSAFVDRFSADKGKSLKERFALIKDEFNRYKELQMTKYDTENTRKRISELTLSYTALLTRTKAEGTDPFGQIRARLTEREYIISVLRGLESELNDLEQRVSAAGQKSPTATEEQLLEQIKRVDTDLTFKRQELTLKEQQLIRLEKACEPYDGVVAERLAAERTLAELTESLEIIQKTAELLTEASERMALGYLDLTRNRLSYYRALLGAEAQELRLDTDFRLTKSDRGEQREADSYSRGTKELDAFALQLALCDSLYSEAEMPPLILDDPFSAFDDGRVAKGLELLRKMSQDRQILYFTCSSSRAFSGISFSKSY